MIFIFERGSKFDFFWASIPLRFLLTFLINNSIFRPVSGGTPLRPVFLFFFFFSFSCFSFSFSFFFFFFFFFLFPLIFLVPFSFSFSFSETRIGYTKTRPHYEHMTRLLGWLELWNRSVAL